MIDRVLFVAAAALAFWVAIAIARRYAGRRRLAVLASDETAPADAAASTVPTLLYLHAAHCGQCKAQARSIAELETRLGERFTVRRVDALDEPETATRYQVWTVPSTVVLDHCGRPTAVNYGLASAEKLEQQLRAAGLSAGVPAAA